MPRPEPSPSSPRYWLPVTAPALAWATQGLVGWFVVAHACPGGMARAPHAARLFSPAAARWLIAGVTAAALAVSAWAVMVGLGRWRTLAADGRGELARERVRFVATAGMFVATALGVGLVWAGLPAWLLHVCGATQ
jgi:hypothetical protein